MIRLSKAASSELSIKSIIYKGREPLAEGGSLILKNKEVYHVLCQQ
jgi:hypothetical protein